MAQCLVFVFKNLFDRMLFHCNNVLHYTDTEWWSLYILRLIDELFLIHLAIVKKIRVLFVWIEFHNETICCYHNIQFYPIDHRTKILNFCIKL